MNSDRSTKAFNALSKVEDFECFFVGILRPFSAISREQRERVSKTRKKRGRAKERKKREEERRRRRKA